MKCKHQLILSHLPTVVPPFTKPQFLFFPCELGITVLKNPKEYTSMNSARLLYAEGLIAAKAQSFPSKETPDSLSASLEFFLKLRPWHYIIISFFFYIWNNFRSAFSSLFLVERGLGEELHNIKEKRTEGGVPCSFNLWSFSAAICIDGTWFHLGLGVKWVWVLA